MSNQIPCEDIEQSLEQFSINAEASMSPTATNKYSKQFCSPFHIAEFSQALKPESSSPDFLFQFTNSFKRIMENENEEESSESSEMFDIMGHRINQFNAPTELEDIPEYQYVPGEEDKENDIPYSNKTPLKIERRELRSPLQDITPSMTHKKIKTTSKLSISQKRNYLTPRTMEKSRLASSGLRKIQRL